MLQVIVKWWFEWCLCTWSWLWYTGQPHSCTLLICLLATVRRRHL